MEMVLLSMSSFVTKWRPLVSEADNPIDHFLSYSIAAAHRKIHTSLAELIRSSGLQVEAWRVLETLRSTDALTMSELAEIVLLNPPTLTKLVDRMVAEGLVQRQLADKDQRRVNLKLTDFGLQTAAKILNEVEGHNQALISQLGEKQAQALKEALDQL